MRAAARRRDRRIGTTRQRVSRWEQGVTPDAFSQQLPTDVFGVPYDHVLAVGRPHWLPGYDAPASLGERADHHRLERDPPVWLSTAAPF
jgi:transcriptional regulator with XRE-family HTH domain